MDAYTTFLKEQGVTFAEIRGIMCLKKGISKVDINYEGDALTEECAAFLKCFCLSSEHTAVDAMLQRVRSLPSTALTAPSVSVRISEGITSCRCSTVEPSFATRGFVVELSGGKENWHVLKTDTVRTDTEVSIQVVAVPSSFEEIQAQPIAAKP